MFWYLKKNWYDPAPDIDEVKLHYVWGPHGSEPDWGQFGQVRSMSTDAERVEGKGRVSPYEGRGETRTVWPLPPGMREKIIKVPQGFTNGRFGLDSENFLLHHFFEVRQNGSTYFTDKYVEEIVSWEVEYVDWHGTALAICAHWGIGDTDAMAYTPTEDPRFVEWYGQDSEFRSIKIYDTADLLRFSAEKWKLLQMMPLPRRFRCRLWAPRGSQIIQGWHVIHTYRCPQSWPLNDSDEIYEGYTTYRAGE